MSANFLDRRRFATRNEARRAVFEYIEGWYNPHRRHSALGYESPLGYEKRCAGQDSERRKQNEELVGVGAGADGDCESQR